MSGSIPVSQKHGINPTVLKCSICHEGTGELALIGKANKIKCSCGAVTYGRRVGSNGRLEKCSNCDADLRNAEVLEFDIKVPNYMTVGICDKCKKMLEEHDSVVVNEGGIYWKCSKCGSSGVIKPSGMTKMVREKMKLDKPEMIGDKKIFQKCGIDFEGTENCPVCHRR